MKLIKGGLVIDPSSDREGQFDILIDGDKIKEIDRPGTFDKAQAEVIDAKDRWVVPGLVDLHVHLREPGFEWKETVKTGCEAALLGGYTTVCCMPNTNPVNDTAEVTRYIIEKAREAGARVLPIGAVSLGSKGVQLAHLEEQMKAGCVAFSDDGEPVYNAGVMRKALEWCERFGVAISCHEEDKSLSCGGCMNESGLSARMGLVGMPTVAEDVMVARDIELARYTGGKVHICHVSSARSVELIRRAKKDGIQITAEVTAHHLTLTEDLVEGYDTNAKMSPPLRGEADRLGLIEGLKDGTLDALASDHAPHEYDSKNVEFAKASMGILGLQTSLSLMLDFVSRGVITRRRAIDALAAAPARCFGLEYGTLRKGALADLTIIDPTYRWQFRKEIVKSKSFNSPFLGRELCGIADTVLVGGRVVVSNQQLKV